MLSLSYIPCTDSEDCHEISETKILAFDDHNHGSHETEACTPFCSCACCAVPVQVQQVFYTVTPLKHFQSFDFQYSDDFRSYTAHAIWQPPRLG